MEKVSTQGIWSELTEDEVVFVLECDRSRLEDEHFEALKKIKTLKAKLVAVKAQRDDLIVDKLENQIQQ